MIEILLGIVFFVFFGVFVWLRTPIFWRPTRKKELAEVNVQALKRHVYHLIETPQPRNYQNLDSLNQAADYIRTELLKMGLPVGEQVYQIGKGKYRNIVSYYGNPMAHRIVIGAHYDVCGEQDGADDNASGIAALLELAQLFQKYKPKLNYRVDFVAYTLEEPPFFKTKQMGSYIHAKVLFDNEVPVDLMVCLDMVGFYSDEPNSQKYPIPILEWIYPKKANFIAVVGNLFNVWTVRHVKHNLLKNSEIQVRSINAPTSLAGLDYSDHRNYWHFGYNAVMITDTAFYRNPNYHKDTDKLDTLNYDKMGEVVRGLYASVLDWRGMW